MDMLNTERICFDFRLVDLPDGSQLINDKVKTPIDALTPEMQVEYMEVYSQLSYLETLKRQARREADRQRKLARNPLYRLANAFGLVLDGRGLLCLQFQILLQI